MTLHVSRRMRAMVQGPAMFIQTNRDMVARSLAAATLDERVAMASGIVMRIEALAQVSRKQRSDFVAVRTCLDELRAVCAGAIVLRPYLERGREVVMTLSAARRIEIEAVIARRSERTAAAAARAEMLKEAEIRKRRIVRIIEAAALVEQPSRFSSQIRQCALMWRETGPCGCNQRLLFEGYRASLKAFWDAVRLEHATTRKLGAEAGAPAAPRRHRWLLAFFAASDRTP